MKNLLLASSLCFLSGCATAQTPAVNTSSTTIGSIATGPLTTVPTRDLYSDTWVATDALGRSLPLGGQVRAPQPGKIAALFYYLWQQDGSEVNDISKALAANPQNPQLGGRPSFHWWGEPEAGYFRADDPWVIHRNLSMISDAGVDVIFFDVTNAFTYMDTVKALCQTAMEMRARGEKTPQIGFLTNARAGKTQTELYNEFYSKNLYRELWFQWDGKPLIMGDVDATMEDKSPMSDEVKNFFSWRKSWAWATPTNWYGDGKGKWPWLDNSPQQPGLSHDGKLEQIVVETAQHPTTFKGKSFQNGKQPPIDALGLTPDTGKGLYFAEQWKRALEVDPPLVFVTQWNEWIAQRFIGGQDGHPSFLGRPVGDGESFFVDVYNAEFNRDIEPMKGGWNDNYYYQLVDGLRRFKGARPVPIATAPRNLKIKLNGKFEVWNGVGPEYRDTLGDTMHRDHRGWTKELIYKNDSGRNDIASAKVARDAKNLFFYVQTAAPLTPNTDPNWMMLFIDADQNPKSGWHGYDLRVRAGAIERFQNGNWVKVGVATSATGGNQLVLRMPRRLLGNAKPNLSFDFKWVDNAAPNKMEEWFTNGDVAPNRRFNYRFLTASPN